MVTWILEYYDMDDYAEFDDYLQALDIELRSSLPPTVYDELNDIWNETEQTFITDFFEMFKWKKSILIENTIYLKR